MRQEAARAMHLRMKPALHARVLHHRSISRMKGNCAGAERGSGDRSRSGSARQTPASPLTHSAPQVMPPVSSAACCDRHRPAHLSAASPAAEAL